MLGSIFPSFLLCFLRSFYRSLVSAWFIFLLLSLLRRELLVYSRLASLKSALLLFFEKSLRVIALNGGIQHARRGWLTVCVVESMNKGKQRRRAAEKDDSAGKIHLYMLYTFSCTQNKVEALNEVVVWPLSRKRSIHHSMYSSRQKSFDKLYFVILFKNLIRSRPKVLNIHLAADKSILCTTCTEITSTETIFMELW